MLRHKKQKNISENNELFSVFRINSIKNKNLIKSDNNSLLNDISSSFHDQFYYSVLINENRLEIFYSPSAEKVTGYTQKQLFDLDLLGRELIMEEDLPLIKEQLTQIEDGTTDSLDLLFRIKRKDNQIIWLREQLRVKRENNSKIRIVGLLSDVTDFQSKENEYLKSLKELRNQITVRDNFLSVLSHDLRAPFSSILGFTEILLSDAVLSDQERTEYLNYINDSSNNQLRLVNYLLDWSNLQTGRLNVNKQRVHAQTLVFNSISALTGNAVRKNIEIKVDIPQTIFIEIDEKLITQVLSNLVSNAIKFSDEQKSVNITADRFNNDYVEFIIKDEGIGIPEHFQSRIFKFDKMFSTRGTKGERGTGLGLSLVKEIVEKHGGQIWFYSKEREGSEFHFTVPSSENIILLVENNKEDYSAFEQLIKENYPEFKFLGIGDGFEAINIVLKRHPSLIITSHNLPLMNGLQFIKSIQRGDRRFYTPIIALLETVDDTIIKSYDELGIKSILYKPIDSSVANREINLALS